ncbi:MULTISPECIES: hypothetical protein [unclassified Rickettsia]
MSWLTAASFVTIQKNILKSHPEINSGGLLFFWIPACAGIT